MGRNSNWNRQLEPDPLVLAHHIEAECRDKPRNTYAFRPFSGPLNTVAMRQGLSCRRRKGPVTLPGTSSSED
jgi:hypothetical protein